MLIIVIGLKSPPHRAGSRQTSVKDTMTGAIVSSNNMHVTLRFIVKGAAPDIAFLKVEALDSIYLSAQRIRILIKAN